MDGKPGKEKDGIDAAPEDRDFPGASVIFFTPHSGEGTMKRVGPAGPKVFPTQPTRRTQLPEPLKDGRA
ncbi:MAG TPA: hypothetical protein ENN44_00065 [Methanoculleus sp.]|nr:hypothetical protein [Methanoculleus sp.]